MITLSANARQPERATWSLERFILERSLSLGFDLDPTTIRAYSSHLNSYLSFCAAHNFPVEPTIDTLSFYVVYMCHYIQLRSVECYLSGIVSQLEPYYPSIREIRQSQLVWHTLKGSARRFGRPVVRKQPLLREDLVRVVESMQRPFSFDDHLWIAQLLVGFFGLMRLGELVWPDQLELQDYAKLSQRHSVCLGDGYFSFLLPRDKADIRFEGNQVVIQRSSGMDDPLAPFLAYLKMRDFRFPLQPFLWLRVNGKPPSCAWFIRRLRHFFDTSIAGHSLHAGGTTSLAAAGVPPASIQRIGRWRSDTWERYVCKNPVLLQALLFHGRSSIHDVQA